MTDTVGWDPTVIITMSLFTWLGLSECQFKLLVFSQGAILQCVHMPRVNLEGATLRGCSMDERLGVRTNLEGMCVCVHVCMYLNTCCTVPSLVMVDYPTLTRSANIHHERQFKELRPPGPSTSRKKHATNLLVYGHTTKTMQICRQVIVTLNRYRKLIIVYPLQANTLSTLYCPSSYICNFTCFKRPSVTMF